MDACNNSSCWVAKSECLSIILKPIYKTNIFAAQDCAIRINTFTSSAGHCSMCLLYSLLKAPDCIYTALHLLALLMRILYCMANVSMQATSLSHIRAHSLLTAVWDCWPPTSDRSSLCNTICAPAIAADSVSMHHSRQARCHTYFRPSDSLPSAVARAPLPCLWMEAGSWRANSGENCKKGLPMCRMQRALEGTVAPCGAGPTKNGVAAVMSPCHAKLSCLGHFLSAS